MDGRDARSGDELVADFLVWASDDRVAAAARARSRERSLRQQATESATLAGVLLDLAEAGLAVALTTRGAALTGRVVGVGADVLVIEDGRRSPALVRLDAVGTVSPLGPGARREVTGDRSGPLALSFVDCLESLAADRSPVRLGLSGGDAVAGDLMGLGADVVVVRRHDADGRRVYVALTAVEVVGLR